MLISISRNRLRDAAGSFCAALSALLCLLGPFPLHAQQPLPSPNPLVGRVVHEGLPVASIPVTLHRVTSQGSGEVGETVTNAEGEFRFSLETDPGADFTVFFVTTDYLSVPYFGHPVQSDELIADYTVVVYDTTSVPEEPVRIIRRDMVLIPEETGSWEVNEVLRILNPGRAALVPGARASAWDFRILPNAGEFQAREGDILPHEVTLMDDRVLLITPVAPGERDLFIRYRLPVSPAEAVLPLDQPTDTVNLFVQQPAHLTGVEGLATAQMVEAGGEQFLRYSGASFGPGAEIILRWSQAGTAPVDPVLAAVVATLLLLGVGIWAALRYRRPLAS